MTQHAPHRLLRMSAVALSGALTLAMSVTALAATPPTSPLSSSAAGPLLAVLEGYAVLASSSVSNVGATVLNADLGVSPGLAVTGFPPGIVNGETHVADDAAATAASAAADAYEGLAAHEATGTVAGALAGQVLTPGTYRTDSAATLDGTLVLDAQGDVGAFFVVQASVALDTSAAAAVELRNGAAACRVFWQVTGTATLGPGSSLAGTVLAGDTIELGRGAGVDGRVLAPYGGVTMDSNQIVQSPCPDVPGEPPVDPPTATAPNIVFVLVDDLSANLLPYMTEVQALAADGVTFDNFFVATPWCCPSRASFQAGQYPHNTGVLSNKYPLGGFERFLTGGMGTSIGVQMQDNGYRTGMMGKYLNGYNPKGQRAADQPYYPPDFVPPGWNSWFAGAKGYQHFRYSAVESVDNSPPVRKKWKGNAESNYYTDVLSDRAQAFLSTPGEDPFFLMLTPFAPHVGGGGDPQSKDIKYPPAPRDRARSSAAPKKWAKPTFADGDCGVTVCADVPWPDSSTPENVNRLTTNPLPWMSTEPLTEKRIARGRELHVQRIQMVQAVNDMLAELRQTLVDNDQADNTYVVFGSDNGYHLGEHALFGGKTTAYDHDVKIPLIVHPPGGSGAPLTVDAFVQSVDVLPTVVELAGGVASPGTDGVSLVPLLAGQVPPWRAAVLLELMNDGAPDDGRQPGARGLGRVANPDTMGYEGDHVAPTYNALRTDSYLYIDYSVLDGVAPLVGQAEFYDLGEDPGQTVNRYAELSLADRTALDAELAAQAACAGAQCWSEQADVPAVLLAPLG